MSLSEAERRKRGSGRSTRMMFEAHRELLRGKKVIIVINTRQDRGFLEAIERRHGLTVGQVVFQPFDEITGPLSELLGDMSQSPTVSVLCDHYVIESRYRPLLEEWPESTEFIDDNAVNELAAGALVKMSHPKGGNLAEFPEELRLREFPDVIPF